MAGVHLSAEPRLCHKCNAIFCGYWAERDSVQSGDPISEAWEEDSSHSEPSEESQFYERPDWIHALNEGEQDQAAMSPLMHHGVSDLRPLLNQAAGYARYSGIKSLMLCLSSNRKIEQRSAKLWE